MNPIYKQNNTPGRKVAGLTKRSGFRIMLSVLIIITLIFIWTNSMHNGIESNAAKRQNRHSAETNHRPKE